jgi:hypothetical protein
MLRFQTGLRLALKRDLLFSSGLLIIIYFCVLAATGISRVTFLISVSPQSWGTVFLGGRLHGSILLGCDGNALRDLYQPALRPH